MTKREKDWTEIYIKIKNTFCERCEIKKCDKNRRMFCAEQFLYITENYEITERFNNGKE